MYKRCTKCETLKTLDEFSELPPSQWTAARKDGRRSRCKPCTSADNAASRRRSAAKEAQRVLDWSGGCTRCGGVVPPRFADVHLYVNGERRNWGVYRRALRVSLDLLAGAEVLCGRCHERAQALARLSPEERELLGL